MFNKIGNAEKQDTYIGGFIKTNNVTTRHRPDDNSKPKPRVCKYKVKINNVRNRFVRFWELKKFRVERIVKLLLNNEPSPIDRKHSNIGTI